MSYEELGLFRQKTKAGIFLIFSRELCFHREKGIIISLHLLQYSTRVADSVFGKDGSHAIRSSGGKYEL